MRRLLKVALAVVCGLAPLHAGFILNFDENGNGSISINSGSFQTFNGSLINDPSSTLGQVLAWNFGGFGITFAEGDVLIADASTVAQPISDALRFTDSNGGLAGAGGNIMIFYSADTSGGLLADTGFPSNLGGVVGATENAAGNFTYSPSANTYNGLSGAVPEPVPVATLGLGLAALLAMKFKSKSRSTM